MKLYTEVLKQKDTSLVGWILIDEQGKESHNVSELQTTDEYKAHVLGIMAAAMWVKQNKPGNSDKNLWHYCNALDTNYIESLCDNIELLRLGNWDICIPDEITPYDNNKLLGARNLITTYISSKTKPSRSR